MTESHAKVRLAIVSTGTLRSYVTLERAVAFARVFGGNVPTGLLVPAHEENRELVPAVHPAALILVGVGRIWEPLSKWLWLMKHRPSIMYCVGGWYRNILPALLARPFTNAKVVADLDEVMSLWPSAKRFIYWLLERAFVRTLDAYVAVSRAMVEWAVRLGAVRSSVLYVPFAADTESIADAAGSASASNTGGDVIRIGYLGSLTLHYDFWYLLDALESLLRIAPDVQLHLVGDGPGRYEFERRARDRDLLEHVELWGYRPMTEAAAILARCHVLLFPLRDTAINRLRCPQKAYIYLAIGTPIATCAVGEVKTAVDGYSGFFDMDDRSTLVAAVREALLEPRTRRAERQMAARRYHSWRVRAAQCQELLARRFPELLPREEITGAREQR
jgi:glycosyltransferase involved in cell wall biosynthesis